jgi:hypothetical protein
MNRKSSERKLGGKLGLFRELILEWAEASET